MAVTHGRTSALGINIIDQFQPLVQTMICRLKQQPGVRGIVLLGGLAQRHFIDRFSDLDLAVFVSAGSCTSLPPFSFTVKSAQ
jgi:hypothetical protein